MQKYICKESWKRHTKGDVITDWEYKKLPVEIKKHFELINDIESHLQILEDMSDFSIDTTDPKLQDLEPDIIQIDASKHLFSPKKKKIEATADIDKIIDSE